MFQKLVNHNTDIQLLVEKGYAVAFDSNCMVIRDIPYLDSEKQLQIGTIVTKLVFIDNEHVKQHNHQIYFAGSSPCSIDGRPIPNLADRPHDLVLSEASKDVIVRRSFSNKPKKIGRFEDFFEKIESYVAIISGPAMELYSETPYTFRNFEDNEPDSVFLLHDTLTSRAEIADLSAKFEDDVIAIIGAGGTGSYVLDFLVNTPVREIRVFDLNTFHVHNAFRSPGKTIKGELGKKKTSVYKLRYKNFRSGLSFEPKFIDESSSDDFEGVTFVFVCVDKGSSRDGIFKLLLGLGIPFIDVGIGLKRKEGSLTGTIRTTYYSVDHGQQVREQGLAMISDNPDDIYKTNIQISEINALNASLAVIKFKQLRGFYYEEESYYHSVFRVGDHSITGISESDED